MCSQLRIVRKIALAIFHHHHSDSIYGCLKTLVLYMFWLCSQVSYTSWCSRDYCIQSWSSPTWLCPCHYHGSGRGTSACSWLICLIISVLFTSNIFELALFFKPQVVKAAQGRVPVFLDGGVRRGTDVFKALALGASGIFVRTHAVSYSMPS